MANENVIPFLFKKTNETVQIPNENQAIKDLNEAKSPLIDANKKRVLRNEVAARVATLEKAA